MIVYSIFMFFNYLSLLGWCMNDHFYPRLMKSSVLKSFERCITYFLCIVLYSSQQYLIKALSTIMLRQILP